MIQNKEYLITGGSGSLGKVFVKTILKYYDPKGIRVYSRDELKQWEMKQELGDEKIAYLIGDVRDYERLKIATRGVDIIIHAAAMKQVPTCEKNPIETINTNINGTINIVKAATINKVKKSILISTDKAVYPINLYGNTKAVAEKLFIDSNNSYGAGRLKFSVCRYGNIINSRGSIIPLFKEQAKKGKITITHKQMTRFFLSLDNVVSFILSNLIVMEGSEIFIPKMPSVKIIDIVKAVSEQVIIKEIGIRAGEKLHECLVAYEEGKRIKELSDRYIIYPNEIDNNYDFEYNSDTNDWWLNEKDILEMVK